MFSIPINRSLETPVSESQSIDLKRQLQVVEQEASVLRTKTQTLEQENDKMLAEVKQLQLQVARGTVKSTPVKDSTESDKLKKTVEELEKEREELKTKLKIILEEPVSKMPARIPKVYSDIKTKMQLKVSY